MKKRAFVIAASVFLAFLVISMSFASAQEKASADNVGFFGKFINWLKSLFSSQESSRAKNVTAGNLPTNESGGNQTENSAKESESTKASEKVIKYDDKISFSSFQDPNEKAFTMDIPSGWQVGSGSGLTRHYIDAGTMISAESNNSQRFFFVSPYAVYTVPNAVLDFAGFKEGSAYDPSGGIARAMIVKKYTNARDYLNEYIQQLNVQTQVIEIIDRPDLIKSNQSPLITQQSAAEITYMSNPGTNQLKNKVIAYIYLVETSGTGVWAVSLFGYHAPETLFNETEYLVLKSEGTFRVDPDWAKREAEEVNKRLGIISSTQSSISDSISSTFEYKSKSMDDINDKWSKTILGVEEVYDTDTGEMFVVDSGSKYYWIDNRNNIYGTDTYQNPFPQEDVRLMKCDGC